jgi:hypothetical protein
MFEPTSRYFAVEEATLTLPDGRIVAYKRRRFIPHTRELTAAGAVTVGHGERLDLVSARALGDPEQFWRLCDANGALDPAELEVTGRRLTIPEPRP